MRAYKVEESMDNLQQGKEIVRRGATYQASSINLGTEKRQELENYAKDTGYQCVSIGIDRYGYTVPDRKRPERFLHYWIKNEDEDDLRERIDAYARWLHSNR